MSYEEISEIYGSEEVYNSACKNLAGFTNIKDKCSKAGAQYDEDSGRITIAYMNRQCLLTLPSCQLSLTDSNEEITAMDKTLIVHYLTMAKGTPLTDRLITYKQVPGGTPYFARFSHLVVEPLLSHFGEEPEMLIPAAEKLGGEKVNRGDVAVTIKAFSRVPVTIVLQRGDEEFPPTASVLFDSTVPDYLPSEDIRILCEIIVAKLIKHI